MRISPAWRVYILGAIVCVSLTIGSRYFTDRGGPHFMTSLAFAGVAYLLAVRELFATPKFSRSVLAIGLLLAAVWHIEFLRLLPGADDDIHRYVWDGRLQRLGYNPYLVIPSDPAFQHLHTTETRSLNNPELPTPYPPGAQLFFRAVSAIQESTFAFKVAFMICEVAIVFLLLDFLRSNRQGTHLLLAFAWNPLLAIEVAGNGHIDIFGALLLVMSATALARRWRAVAAVTLGLAIAVKFLPIVLFPLYWKRIRVRDAVLAVTVVVLLYLPFLTNGGIPIGSLGTYVQNFRFNGPLFAALDRIIPPRSLAGLAVLVGFATAIWLRREKSKTLTTGATWFHRENATVAPPPDSMHSVVQASAFVWPMAATLLFAPAVFPWYLIWLVPFLTSRATLVIAVWTVSIIPVYVQWHLRALGHPWGALPGWTMLVEYGCVAIAAILICIPRIRVRSTLRESIE